MAKSKGVMHHPSAVKPADLPASAILVLEWLDREPFVAVRAIAEGMTLAKALSEGKELVPEGVITVTKIGGRSSETRRTRPEETIDRSTRLEKL